MDRVLFFPILFLFLGTAHLYGETSESLSGILDGLRDIEIEMSANQQRIDGLQSEIGRLQLLGRDADAEILGLQTLVEDHAGRVLRLGERYSQALQLAQQKEKDLRAAQSLNWVLGGAAVLVAVIAVGEGVALARR